MSESDFRYAESKAFVDRLDVRMKTKRSQRMPHVYCLQNQKHKVAISEMSKKTKGTDFEGVLEVYLKLARFDMIINLSNRSVQQAVTYECRVQGRDRG